MYESGVYVSQVAAMLFATWGFLNLRKRTWVYFQTSSVYIVYSSMSDSVSSHQQINGSTYFGLVRWNQIPLQQKIGMLLAHTNQLTYVRGS